MTSTDTRRGSHRLPPLGGLLEDMVDEAIRARRRRVMTAEHPALNLNALRVTDGTLDRLVQGIALYGNDGPALLEARIGALDGAAREGAVFVRIALAVHTREAALAQLAEQHAQHFRAAVRDAYWFYPVPNGPFSDGGEHVALLYEYSAGNDDLRLLAVELAGLRDERALAAQMASLLDEPRYAPAARLALARMGRADDTTRRHAHDCLALRDPARNAEVNALLASDPRIADDALLALALEGNPATLDAAWAIASCRDPQRTGELAASRADLPAALRARVHALTGSPVGIIAACAAMAGAGGAIPADQADVLELALGMTPLEARCEPNDQAARDAALRALLLRVFRKAHIGLRNDADIGPWEAHAILADPAQARGLRLRGGAPMAPGVPALGAAVMEVTHALRQWLFIERAVSARHALSLSPFDTARRQDGVLMAAEFVDTLRTP